MNKLFQWVKGNSAIIVNAGSLIGTTAVTSLLGFVYWWVAARRGSPDAVGISSAAVSAMILLGNFAIMGVGTLLITELPRQPGRAKSLVSTSLLIVSIVGCSVGLCFTLVAPLLSPSFAPLRSNPLTIVFFTLGVGTTAVTQVLDQALIGLLRGGLQLWRNTLFSVAKLLLVFAVSLWLPNDSMMLYATWPLGNMLSLLLLLPFACRRLPFGLREYRPQWGLLRKLGMSAIQHHLLNLTLLFPALVLPMLVTVLLSAKMNGWFYVSWMIASFVFLVPNALTIVLHAVNSAQQAMLTQKARLTMSLGLVICLLANGVIQLAPTLVLGFFGSVYADQASLVLRILVLAAFPLLIKNHYISICRIQDRIIRAMIALLPGSLLEIAAAAIGAHVAGLAGLAIAWVAVITVESLFMVPTVYRVIRGAHSSAQTSLAGNMRQPEMDAIWLIDTSPLPIFVRHMNVDSSRSVGIEAGIEVGIEQQETLKMIALSATQTYDISHLDTLTTLATPKTWHAGDRGGQFRPWPRHAGPVPVGATSRTPTHPASSHDVKEGH